MIKWRLLILLALGLGAQAASGPEGLAWVAPNDVVYLAPAREGWEGLPLGNGTLGAQMWQPEEGLLFQLNTPLSGVYGGALGRLRLKTDQSMFAGLTRYRQTLALGTATVSTDIDTRSGTIHFTACIPTGQDALIVEFADARTGQVAVVMELETWRKSAVCRVKNGVLLVTDTLTCSGQPDYRFALALAVDGASATPEATGSIARLQISGGTFTAFLAVAGTREAKGDVAEEALAKLATLRRQGFGATSRANADWWAGFWARSYVSLSSDDGAADYLANLWYLHLYAMAAGSRGELPPKFNGGLWTDDYDVREWGRGYWHWNTQESYWPLFAANHLELNKPYQQLYWNMLPAVKDATTNTFNLPGAFFQETVGFEGPAKVAPRPADAPDGVKRPTTRTQTGMIFSTSAEIAMQFWWAYLYDGDTAFLRDRAYPLMKEVATFYIGYLQKDAEGRYFMWPSNAHETYLFVKNPTPDLAGIRYLFPALLEASRILGVDENLRPVWQDRLDHLSPYPLDKEKGIILPYEPKPGETRPAENGENPELFPIGVFPLITVGSPDYDLAVKTFLARRNVCAYGWTTDGICAARLGLADDPVPYVEGRASSLPRLLILHAERYQNHPSGLQDYYSRQPAVHPYLEGSGTFATALNEMLLQSWGGVIRLCPALPKSWNAVFKLLAMGGFEVTATAVKGKVTEVSVFSRRGGLVQMVNPFDGPARITLDGKPVGDVSSDSMKLAFPTEAGKTYRIDTPADPASTEKAIVRALPNDAPKRLSLTSANWIGKPPLPSLSLPLTAEQKLPQPPASAGSLARPGRPEMRAVRVTTQPLVDGRLGEALWTKLPPLGAFLKQGKQTAAEEPTEVRVGYDDKALYLGITCWESRMADLFAEFLPTQHDRQVALDDSVEVVLRTPGGTTWHFAVNALGASREGRLAAGGREEPGLNPAWTVATACYSNRWVAEIAIPFVSMAPRVPAAGAGWGFNVFRNEKPHEEASAWAPMTVVRSFKTEEFGTLVFPEGPTPSAAPMSDPTLVGHWTFDNVQGPWVFDSSGYGNDGMMTELMAQVPGPVGQALDFRGAAVEVPHNPSLTASNALTLAFWVYPKAISSARLIDKARAGGDEDYMLDLYPDGHLRIITHAGIIFAKDELPIRRWSHVTATFGDGTLRLYVNGKVTDERVTTGLLSPGELPLRIAQGNAVLLDDVRIYRRALTAEEISGLVKSGIVR